MPDKIWLHKDAKYNTGDIVCGYQYEFAQEIECEGIENFVEYVPVDAFIEKACEWIGNNSHNYANNALGKEYLVNDFKNYMKGE